MKKKKFNIIIPAIKIEKELLYCLKKLEKINYKNFFVTIVLDYKNFKKLNKYTFKLKTIISGSVNMARKRNLAAKKFKSDYVAFLDSDAYPNKNWLKYANLYFSKEKSLVVGGPNIPFPKQTYTEMLCHYCKRSFFLNGHLAYRKYKSKKKYINDWLESCNFLLSRDLFLKNNGMNEKIFIGEDQEFFKRLKTRIKNLKILFCPKLFVYHKERGINKFFLQRISFGMDVFSGINFSSGISGLLVSFPLLTLIIIIGLLFSSLSLKIKLVTLLSFMIIVNLLIIFDVKKYLSSVKKITFVTILLNLLNLTYAIGGVLTFLGLRSLIEKKLYRYSRVKD